MACKNCKKDKQIVNKHFYLCLECNNERLHGSKYGKQYKFIKTKKELLKSPPRLLKRIGKRKEKAKLSLFAPKIRQRITREEKILKDEEFYEECFNLSDHKCEECGKILPTSFRNNDGDIVARWRYSHIIPKSIAPNLRHLVKNINHLCLLCHQRWENGNRESMKIYKKNRERLPAYF